MLCPYSQPVFYRIENCCKYRISQVRSVIVRSCAVYACGTQERLYRATSVGGTRLAQLQPQECDMNL
ncbi:hypothetical protein SAMD00079811_48720 [Scytonema sp. HK-05]|nr:hypothetical protein SAMD00079811_48720 [Scytonema sp. HK-05]